MSQNHRSFHCRPNRWLFVVAIVVILCGSAFTQTQTTTTPMGSLLTGIVYFAPYPLLNLAPGFGLGSYLQGDVVAGVVLSAIDVVLATIAVLDATDVVAVPNEVGYFFILARSLPGVVLPVVRGFISGVDTDSLVAPIAYNLLPGFGAGSWLLGDVTGGRLGAAFDVLAVASYFAGGIAGLISDPLTYNPDALGLKIGYAVAIGSAVAGRIIGIVRPIVYRRNND